MNWVDLTAVRSADAVRKREVSPLEVLDAAIHRVEERDPSLNAFVYKGFDDARRQAKKLEDRLMAGEDVGVLAGVPTALKDLFNFYPDWPSSTHTATLDLIEALLVGVAARRPGETLVSLEKLNEMRRKLTGKAMKLPTKEGC